MLTKFLDFFSYNMTLAILMFISGHVLGWFAGNSQFVWEFWSNRPILANVLFGVPAGILFWYGTKFCILDTESLWSVRFIASILSYVAFPIMTWYFMGESIFELKTMVCVFLAFIILLVQIFM